MHGMASIDGGDGADSEPGCPGCNRADGARIRNARASTPASEEWW